MQTLSRVRPNASTTWGFGSIARQPLLAAKISEYIANCSEIELLLGQFLGIVLHANKEAILAIYSSTENRATQLKMIEAAVSATLPPDHVDLIIAVMVQDIRPSLKYRDKLAHWAWGYTHEIPDALLCSDPNKNRDKLSYPIGTSSETKAFRTHLDAEFVFVVTLRDLQNALRRLKTVHDTFVLAMGTVWKESSSDERAKEIQNLSKIKHIAISAERLRVKRQKTL